MKQELTTGLGNNSKKENGPKSMRLFGLIESVRVESIYSYINPGLRNLPVQHGNLFKKLEEYGPNLSVGLEMSSGKKRYEVPMLVFEIQKLHLDLLHYFKSKGNRIHFLVPEEYYNGLALLGAKLQAIKEQYKKPENNNQEKKQLEEEWYKISIEIHYLTTIGKNDSFFRAITSCKPDLVFLGDAHAARLYKMKEDLLKNHGITLEEYWHDEITKSITEGDLTNAAVASDEHLSMVDFMEDVTEVELRKVESPDAIPEFPDEIFMERAYKAVKEGRVTDGNPNYLGTWDLDQEPRGLFEVYLEGSVEEDGGIKGTIEDCLGTATFSGRIDRGRVSFTKVYKKVYDNHILPERPILYEGNLQEDGNYGGFYRLMNRNFEELERGLFKMKACK